MSAESTLYAALSANAPLAAIVSTRIYPDAMPEETAYPAITFSRELTEPVVSISGQKHGEFATVSISAWGKTRGESDSAANAAETALRIAGEHVTARSSGYDSEMGLHGTTLEVVIFDV